MKKLKEPPRGHKRARRGLWAEVHEAWGEGQREAGRKQGSQVERCTELREPGASLGAVGRWTGAMGWVQEAPERQTCAQHVAGKGTTAATRVKVK